MGDPRNVAHAKKVSQEKHHKDKHAPKAGPAPSQHTKNVQTDKKPASVAESAAKSEVAKPTQPAEPTQLEKSLVVLSKLKELEFHSRANIEKLAELSLTIEEELKQKAFAEAYRSRLRRAGCISIQDPGIDRSLRGGVHSLVGFGLTSRSSRILFFQSFRADEQSVSNNTETPIVKK